MCTQVYRKRRVVGAGRLYGLQGRVACRVKLGRLGKPYSRSMELDAPRGIL
jgi:hypothetical protein